MVDAWLALSLHSEATFHCGFCTLFPCLHGYLFSGFLPQSNAMDVQVILRLINPYITVKQMSEWIV